MVGDVRGLVGAPELVFGRPPLVCGRVCVGCRLRPLPSGTGGGEIIMVGDSEGYCDLGLSASLFDDVRDNIFKPAGSVETGR